MNPFIVKLAKGIVKGVPILANTIKKDKEPEQAQTPKGKVLDFLLDLKGQIIGICISIVLLGIAMKYLGLTVEDISTLFGLLK